MHLGDLFLKYIKQFPSKLVLTISNNVVWLKMLLNWMTPPLAEAITRNEKEEGRKKLTMMKCHKFHSLTSTMPDRTYGPQLAWASIFSRPQSMPSTRYRFPIFWKDESTCLRNISINKKIFSKSDRMYVTLSSHEERKPEWTWMSKLTERTRRKM